MFIESYPCLVSCSSRRRPPPTLVRQNFQICAGLGTTLTLKELVFPRTKNKGPTITASVAFEIFLHAAPKPSPLWEVSSKEMRDAARCSDKQRWKKKETKKELGLFVPSSPQFVLTSIFCENLPSPACHSTAQEEKQSHIYFYSILFAHCRYIRTLVVAPLALDLPSPNTTSLHLPR